MPRCSLVPLDGSQPFVVTLPMTLVGAKAGCDFQIDDEAVAPQCCVLALADGYLLLRDLDTDCIRVNGQRVRRAVLLDNDRVAIAGREFRVQYEYGVG